MLKAGTAARRRSLRWQTTLEAHTIRQGVEDFLGELDRCLQERDPGWVGHCKLLVSSEGRAAYASKTAAVDRLRWSGLPAAAHSIEITVYVAIYGLSDADVATVLDSTLADTPIVRQPYLAVDEL